MPILSEVLEEVPAGWRELAKPVIEELLKKGIVFEQIKEKFGRLRIYVSGTTETNMDTVYDALYKLEDDSAHVCIYCGAPGDVKCPRGWYLALCAECEKRELLKG